MCLFFCLKFFWGHCLWSCLTCLNDSGGEKARAALGVFMLRPYNCLMLDEASNHLDRPSAMALAKCLSQFTGTFSGYRPCPQNYVCLVFSASDADVCLIVQVQWLPFPTTLNFVKE